ncbi:jumonji domain-containing protein 6 [Apophysomyces sp. BC1034]|nr:jumonji domain-containing protein 6 [Apophysomyces sp. BC1015]KAG0179474.1 jumonji domain-containing protein 6 [Apophysomyces sp. BC1021]KAG0189880.1 jumonji domain-containing protein 6 [Apophysomyces sp. BC1034]
MVYSVLKDDQHPRKRSREACYRESKTDRCERKIRKAKLKTRSGLYDWGKWKFSERDYWIHSFADTVPRINYQKTSKAEFIERFESKNVPVVITHATDHWRANTCWNEENFLDKYGSHLFKVGEDDDDTNVYLKMKHFLHYTKTDGCKEDSPLYIFDSGFYKDRRRAKKSRRPSDDEDNNNGRKRRKEDGFSPIELLGDYEVPSYFSDDLFKLTGERRRPPYRWLVMGGARSGTGIHTDPLGTSAWNALLKGHKRWCMFPPGTPKHIIDPPMKPHDHEGVSWFTKVFPKFRLRDDPDSHATLGERLGMIEVLQRPGETIFVPGGWAHVVMNLGMPQIYASRIRLTGFVWPDMTIAVTQNFCSFTNIEYVFLCTRHSRPKLGAKLYRKIHALAQRAPKIYGGVAAKLDMLKYVPQIPPSSDESSSSSSSSSSSESSDEDDAFYTSPHVSK